MDFVRRIKFFKAGWGMGLCVIVISFAALFFFPHYLGCLGIITGYLLLAGFSSLLSREVNKLLNHIKGSGIIIKEPNSIPWLFVGYRSRAASIISMLVCRQTQRGCAVFGRSHRTVVRWLFGCF